MQLDADTVTLAPGLILVSVILCSMAPRRGSDKLPTSAAVGLHEVTEVQSPSLRAGLL